jgi:hypothetical protein
MTAVRKLKRPRMLFDPLLLLLDPDGRSDDIK